MRHQGGVSLIELMVTVAVMAVLAAAGTPFARGWMDSNRQMQARNLVWEGVSQARALALRNPGAVAAGDVAAWLERRGDALQVKVTGGPQAPWNGTLPTGTTTQLADDSGNAVGDLACVAFDNRGSQVAGSGDCGGGADHHRIAIGFGDQEALHVDLL
ncbi:prepilin-type N-terminal cleavage/methylation domain-containing protein [Stenotrophomonas mori]|uniref:Prepilin-type N-terminal cleavage/methylation domain-containing protein n=1 Tax=Stenotrophomonas mori TaxID=2871096 RepID=A0ABT0SGS2_9GAMM|nr:prepilin-type N-terminal cleavage/methylation domain-containing protein [Stenotrophomonas mori]MCL7714512.1 prepilin-type N-terminal cleavage/methylation domain-containing protein [Stenotrophomonas mori]